MEEINSNNILIKNVFSTKDKTTYELKLLDNNFEEINISEIKNEGRFTDEGYTLYSLSAIKQASGKKGITSENYNAIKSIAEKFGVNLIDSELTILKDSDTPNAKHYEVANLLNCIISINALSRFTNIFG